MRTTPKPTEDELLAAGALHIIGCAGWQSQMHSGLGRHTCLLIRNGVQFRSRPHLTRAGAVSEVAARLASPGRDVCP
jgi:hypothetical protein